MPAPEQAHATLVDARLQAFNPDSLQDEPVARTQGDMPPQELHTTAAMCSEMIEAREERVLCDSDQQ